MAPERFLLAAVRHLHHLHHEVTEGEGRGEIKNECVQTGDLRSRTDTSTNRQIDEKNADVKESRFPLTSALTASDT